MTTLPANLPSIANAKLPAVYESAKSALGQCTRIDECKDWADKAQALASYAKQAEDKSLLQMAVRIQARAIRRCGELLKAVEPAQGKRTDKHRGGAPTRSDAARAAGLSRDQKNTALRVASVPRKEFDAAVESDNPPTVTKLAERGTKRVAFDLQGRDPEDFRKATATQGHLRSLTRFAADVTPAAVFRGLFDDERGEVLKQSKAAHRWLGKLIERLERG